MTHRFSFVVAAAFGLCSCVPDQPLLTTGIFTADLGKVGACEITTVSQLVSGSLDLAGGGGYVVNIGLKNELVLPIEATLASAHAYTITLDSVVLTYTSFPVIDFGKPETTPMTFTVSPGSTPSTLQTGLFTRNALEKLVGKLPGNTTDVVDLKVKIVYSGSVASGGRISSTPITFPMTIFNSGFKCPAGDSFVKLGPCGNPGGQDGSRLCCASDVTCVVVKK